MFGRARGRPNAGVCTCAVDDFVAARGVASKIAK